MARKIKINATLKSEVTSSCDGRFQSSALSPSLITNRALSRATSLARPAPFDDCAALH